ncbi:MAG: hypothetical protein Q8L24_02670 [bacterium]|nr:hypothetical protein [bacterium]
MLGQFSSFLKKECLVVIWRPDPEFLEFLMFLEAGHPSNFTLDGKNSVIAMKEGTPNGQKLYRSLCNSPIFQVSFQNWKKMMASFVSDGPDLLLPDKQTPPGC